MAKRPNIRNKLRFLLIEDRDDDALLLERHLRSSFEFEWEVISSEQDLMEALNKGWDIVFSDYSMPSFSGIRALEITREHNPELPFIFVSGTITEEMAVTAMSKGAQDFVMKDNKSRLLPAVERELRKMEMRRQAEGERARLTAILEVTPDFVIILEPDGHIRYLNESGRSFFGIGPDKQINGLNISSLFKEATVNQFNSTIFPVVAQHGVWAGESKLEIEEGSELPVSMVVLGHRGSDGEIDYLSINARDISERIRYEATLQHKANHDSLTGLPNRYFLTDRFTAELESAKRKNYCIGVLYLDVDNFKRINDSLGHEAGDVLLKQVARRLKECIRPGDTVARIGGDEFTIVASDFETSDKFLSVLRRIKKAFEPPIVVSLQEVYVTFSAGIAIYPYDGDNAGVLLRNADAAMYKAKMMGANQYSFYSSDMNIRSHELLLLESELKNALSRKELQLYYQPQLNLQTNKITGLEALIRWNHPRRGLIPPSDFIPMLENTGMIVDAGEWVLREACRTYSFLKKAGIEVDYIGVNVSTVQFNDNAFLDMVRNTLIGENVPPHGIQLEITENTIMQNADKASQILMKLANMGLSIAIDDFGTGYSSLAYLKKFPLHVLKIDKVFINDIDRELKDAAIVEAGIFLGQKFGFRVLAEGVENKRQLEFLKDTNCDLIQGYYLCKPLPENEIFKYLQVESRGS